MKEECEAVTSDLIMLEAGEQVDAIVFAARYRLLCQRLALARAFVRDAPFVVLDEPSTGLHASDVHHLVAVLQRLADRGDAVCVIEHHTGLLGACDRLGELGPAGGADGGRIVASGTPAASFPNRSYHGEPSGAQGLSARKMHGLGSDP